MSRGSLRCVDVVSKRGGTINLMNAKSTDKTVLLIEDDKNIRELYAMALINAGMHIKMAENGPQGLEVALAEHPDLILLDIDLPLMNGHEVFAAIRDNEWGKTAKVIFLTNHSDIRTIAHTKAMGPEDYIVKANIPMEEMIQKVLAVLN